MELLKMAEGSEVAIKGLEDGYKSKLREQASLIEELQRQLNDRTTSQVASQAGPLQA
jgi:hypothetical protein